MNELDGSFLSHIGMLAQLKHLNLYGNQLTGTIPNHIGSLTQLTFLDTWRESVGRLHSQPNFNVDANDNFGFE